MPDSTIKVLLVEDNPADVLMLRTALAADHLNTFALTCVERIKDGLARLGQERFDIALLDLGLPDSQGLSTFTTFQRAARDLPVIVFSGNTDEAQAIQAVRTGAQDYLVKSQPAFDAVPRAIRYAIERKQAEEKLHESERRFATLFSKSPFPAALSRLSDGVIVDCNEAFQSTEYTREEIIGKTSFELGILTDSEIRARLVAELQARGSVSNAQVTMFTKSGKAITALINIDLVEIDGEKYTLWTVQDLTARKRAEANLHESEARLRNLFETCPDAIFIVDQETNRFISANPAASRQYGYAYAEFMQMTSADVSAEPHKTSEAIRKNVAYVPERLHRRKDGFTFPVEIVGGYFVQGTQHLHTAFVRDITARKRAEEERETLATLVESSPNFTGLASLDGQVQYVNRTGRMLVGLQDADVTRMKIGDLVPPGASSLATAMQAIQQTGQWQGEGELMNFQTHASNPVQAQVFLIQHPQTHQPMALAAVMQDITERKQHEAETARLFAAEQARRKELGALYDLANALVETDSLDQTLDLIVRTAVATTHVTFARLALFENGRFVFRAAHPVRILNTDLFTDCPFPLPLDDFCPQVFAQMEPVVIDVADATLLPKNRQHLFLGIERTVCLVPLHTRDQIIGMLILAETRAPEREPFNVEKRQLARAIGDQAASAIRRAWLHKQTQDDALELENAYEVTIEGWSRALDLRDHETEGHTQRVAELTVELARVFGFTDEQLVHVRRGALLHDIGKMGVPDAILLKPGTLNEQEWEIMRRHPDYAKLVLSPIHYLMPALDIPYCHHEKWDGTGYPRQLKGEEIPLAARLFAVVDVWDAMTSNRVYRAAWLEERVIDYLRTHSGTHFDPQVVTAFLELMRPG